MTTLIRWIVRLFIFLIVITFIAGGAFYWRGRQLREDLFAAFTPVAITNCQMQRIGSANDGGYMLCGNLVQEVRSTYSYGIAGVDDWGCDISARLNVPVHQYDCFNTSAPVCGPTAQPHFYPECIGAERSTFEGKPFDTLANQIEKNGDNGKHLIVKMDVEGAEWESLGLAPDATLESIDQLVAEFHEIESPLFVKTAQRLTKFFYVANVHQNNHSCLPGFDPFPGTVFEALLVNKRIAKVDPNAKVARSSPLDAPNNYEKVDCQAPITASEPQRVYHWMQRVAGVVGWRLFRIPFA